MGHPACRLDVTQQYINTDSCRGFSDYMYIDFNCVPGELSGLDNIVKIANKYINITYLM